ncbi:hypothetical protein AQI95_26245 [Streptomyces yokosukanensis]|uniref:Integral membrane protein n=1 Tax=Streptomyces yokosukanensis TaxID=67386 RepID=A0A117Q145_9ACTN|nr:DUF6113 family protein [Streptomyces yokosukanensis]KUN02334.1 hypothetical protein AQI95_26245 [Streptomyces yokosukanensis]
MTDGGQGSLLAQPLQRPSAARVAAHAGLFLLGAVTGLAGTLVQAAWFPGGLLLALVGAAGLFLGGAYATGGRGGAVAPVAGWIVAVVLLTTARPEGDFLFAAGGTSYLFLLGGMALAVICATLGAGRQPRGGPARLGK